jgi:hypothetical protein
MINNIICYPILSSQKHLFIKYEEYIHQEIYKIIQFLLSEITYKYKSQPIASKVIIVVPKYKNYLITKYI